MTTSYEPASSLKRPVIEIRELTKYYGSRKAVEQLSFTVAEGELFGFIGPNGAGKTSTIRMVATLLQPSSGEILVAGHSVSQSPHAVRRLIGYMPDFFGVYPGMTVGEYLDFFAACYGISKARRALLVEDLLELVDLSHRREDRLESLSQGLKQRLSLARTLVNDPQVLILDEPASGLDPRARVEIRELLVELSHMGKTIFFSTHILADVAEICTRVGIIEAGRLVAIGRLEELQQLLPRRKVEITVLSRSDEARMLLSSLPGVISVEADINQNNGRRSRLQIQFAGDDLALNGVLSALVKRGIPVIQFSADRPDLEAVFLQATKGIVT